MNYPFLKQLFELTAFVKCSVRSELATEPREKNLQALELRLVSSVSSERCGFYLDSVFIRRIIRCVANTRRLEEHRDRLFFFLSGLSGEDAA